MSDSKYPSLLKEIHNPPKRLYCKGNMDLLGERCLTIVGTRKATKYGTEVLNMLLQPYLIDLDICIVSGLAKGIDTMVHRRCLELGIPTIAVIAGGIENIYPLSNTDIYEEISYKGLVLAEHEGRVDMHKGMFPMRNRILAGLSETTIVIEADIQSGSLVTANLALEFNRDVYTIPGDITKDTSRGCNLLIKQGADVITCEDDLKQILGIEAEQLKLIVDKSL
ncbi:DNA-processing protein DprA [Patescibacteria group bacterium]|nr:DNA-processing protein DprA [Patescibacteria group bacterium]